MFFSDLNKAERKPKKIIKIKLEVKINDTGVDKVTQEEKTNVEKKWTENGSLENLLI